MQDNKVLKSLDVSKNSSNPQCLIQLASIFADNGNTCLQSLRAIGNGTSREACKIFAKCFEACACLPSPSPSFVIHLSVC